MIFFRLSTLTLWLIVLGVIFGATVGGLVLGRVLRAHSESLRDPFEVMQAALLGFMGLVLTFTLSLAIQRYEARRGDVVDEANSIGTTYLRAQMLTEPARSESLALLKTFADKGIRISHVLPSSPAQAAIVADNALVERRLWSLAGQALNDAPEANAPRLYIESLNETFDAQASRVAGLDNRVPTTVLLLEVVGAAIALGMLALHLSVLGRGLLSSILAALLASFMLLVTFDLDHPTRGFTEVPSTSLDQVRQSMEAEPALPAPPPR